MGASLSAAGNFLDLFDRTPVIDNTSIEGQELVREYREPIFLVNRAFPSWI